MYYSNEIYWKVFYAQGSALCLEKLLNELEHQNYAIVAITPYEVIEKGDKIPAWFVSAKHLREG